LLFALAFEQVIRDHSLGKTHELFLPLFSALVAGLVMIK